LIAARLPTLLAGLPAVTEEIPLSAPLPPPDLADLEAVRGAADKRRLEYLAGRHCARVALARLGERGHVLRAGADRAPVWPPGLVGSITHTGTAREGFCGAAVARRVDLVALGIDAELNRPLPDELLPTVLTEREREALGGLPPDERGRLAMLVFSAKESLYKALAPLLGVFIEFHEAEIDLDVGAGQFRADVHPAGPAVMSPGIERMSGRLLVGPDLLLTAVVIAPLVDGAPVVRKSPRER
jgi:4'-phosphopantetheinyl transferase EntD